MEQVLISRDEKTAGADLQGNGRLLIMDDHDLILKTLKRVTSVLGYRAEFAKNGTEAISLYKEAMNDDDPFDAVILDLIFPGGMGGKETIKILMEIDKNVKGIVSSGYSTDPIMADYRKYGFKAAIAKPYTLENIGRTLKTFLTDQ
ncbi:MAG: response regulator [Spirochaetales bacterium]|nr:response regulator [Spirochaetales bacterium]